jgi:uncharacterized protein with FMN-binding domain
MRRGDWRHRPRIACRRERSHRRPPHNQPQFRHRRPRRLLLNPHHRCSLRWLSWRRPPPRRLLRRCPQRSAQHPHRQRWNRHRRPSCPRPAATSESLPVPAATWRDGTYTGWGSSRHGDIKAQVVIRNGRIVESSIASCETRWPCDVISTIIHQPVDRQNADVDRVTRATESTNAYYYSLVDALDDALAETSGQTTTSR